MEPHLLQDLEPEITERLVTRRQAIRQGAGVSSGVVAGLAMGSLPVAVAALAADTFTKAGLPEAVVDVLNFALALEHLEAEFYTRGIGASGLLNGSHRDVFDQIRKHEVAHVEFLRSVLGGLAIQKPTFDYTGGMGGGNGPFGDVFSNPRTFATLAQAFEDTGVRAYKGQATNLMTSEIALESALRIHSVEARHASQVRRLRDQEGWIVQDSRGDLPAAMQTVYEGEDNSFHFILGPLRKTDMTTQAFDEPLTKGQVLAIVKPFVAGGL